MKSNLIKKNKTAVITGASSGVGRATALEFASRGINVVIAARGEDALDEAADACRKFGVDVLAVPTDMSKSAEVSSLAAKAVAKYGSIDHWVNNAGVLAFGEFEQMPTDVIEQVIQTNLIGYAHGAHAALNIFKKQGYGVLLNNISIGGWVALPYGTAYSASKFGLRGLTESLQGEYSKYPDIHICALYPGFQNTPGIDHAANYSGIALTTPPPYFDPKRLAAQIADIAEDPKDAVFTDWTAPLIKNTYAIAPKLTRNTMGAVVRLVQKFSHSTPDDPGNVLEEGQKKMQVRGCLLYTSPSPRD